MALPYAECRTLNEHRESVSNPVVRACQHRYRINEWSIETVQSSIDELGSEFSARTGRKPVPDQRYTNTALPSRLALNISFQLKVSRIPLDAG